jgi:hypothetical protein
VTNAIGIHEHAHHLIAAIAGGISFVVTDSTESLALLGATLALRDHSRWLVIASLVPFAFGLAFHLRRANAQPSRIKVRTGVEAPAPTTGGNAPQIDVVGRTAIVSERFRRRGSCPRPLKLPGSTQLSKQQLVQALPHTRLLPLIQTPVARRSRAEPQFERQMPPRHPRVQHEQDPLQRLTVTKTLTTRIARTPLDLRQQRLDPLPQLVRHHPRRNSHRHPQA